MYQSARAGPACRTVVANRRTGGRAPGRVSWGSEAVSRRRTPASPRRQASPSGSMTQGPASLNVPNSVSGLVTVRAYGRFVLGPTGGSSGLHEARLEGEDHRLHAVAQPELGQQPAHVRLDGRLRDVETLGDFRVGQPVGHGE